MVQCETSCSFCLRIKIQTKLMDLPSVRWNVNYISWIFQLYYLMQIYDIKTFKMTRSIMSPAKHTHPKIFKEWLLFFNQKYVSWSFIHSVSCTLILNTVLAVDSFIWNKLMYVLFGGIFSLKDYRRGRIIIHKESCLTPCSGTITL